jgi:hypothetical protein
MLGREATRVNARTFETTALETGEFGVTGGLFRLGYR